MEPHNKIQRAKGAKDLLTAEKSESKQMQLSIAIIDDARNNNNNSSNDCSNDMKLEQQQLHSRCLFKRLNCLSR